MTVCIAAIAEKGTLVGLSDRMLTAGDTEFETEQSKIWPFSNAIAALIAGDTSVQTEILRHVDNEIRGRIIAAPDDWVNVKEVADLYCKRYREMRRSRAEAEILHPVGLDFQSFLQGQASWNADLNARLANELTEYQFAEEKSGLLETIFLGVDHDGPMLAGGKKGNYVKIYVAEGDRLSARTNVGFAAIGVGKSHAESQFMVAGYWPGKLLNEAILIAYSAKKRAESAPGVGKATDFIAIGPKPGNFYKVEDVDLKRLDTIYAKSQKPAAQGFKKALSETQELIQCIRIKTTPHPGTVVTDSTENGVQLQDHLKEKKDG